MTFAPAHLCSWSRWCGCGPRSPRSRVPSTLVRKLGGMAGGRGGGGGQPVTSPPFSQRARRTCPSNGSFGAAQPSPPPLGACSPPTQPPGLARMVRPPPANRRLSTVLGGGEGGASPAPRRRHNPPFLTGTEHAQRATSAITARCALAGISDCGFQVSPHPPVPCPLGSPDWHALPPWS